eukprot:CAMPEP_0173186336 /NCGR_PEP_ID=MMETSP1141-20130122/10083_1 /TAXON_ID=483371 /ORGANISM="non described non described, Strain CCMP2298" /LENGTH=48 /DNA_ID= /DNA_START= /DNA_END= /DNA_ORIENTATION=
MPMPMPVSMPMPLGGCAPIPKSFVPMSVTLSVWTWTRGIRVSTSPVPL